MLIGRARLTKPARAGNPEHVWKKMQLLFLETQLRVRPAVRLFFIARGLLASRRAAGIWAQQYKVMAMIIAWQTNQRGAPSQQQHVFARLPCPRSRDHHSRPSAGASAQRPGQLLPPPRDRTARYASATRAGSRGFHASSARRAFRAAVSSVNGGSGGRSWFSEQFGTLGTRLGIPAFPCSWPALAWRGQAPLPPDVWRPPHRSSVRA